MSVLYALFYLCIILVFCFFPLMNKHICFCILWAEDLRPFKWDLHPIRLTHCKKKIQTVTTAKDGECVCATEGINVIPYLPLPSLPGLWANVLAVVVAAELWQGFGVWEVNGSLWNFLEQRQKNVAFYGSTKWGYRHPSGLDGSPLCFPLGHCACFVWVAMGLLH